MVSPAPVWLVGCNGMLGRQLQRRFQRTNTPLIASDREVDICDIDALRRFTERKPCSWIVNCAAYTAVDAAESDRYNAFALNAKGPENLALVARELDCPLLHISTDYVFDGRLDRPYREDDPTAPQSVYGQSKLAGEQAVRSVGRDHIILRISWLYGVHGKNFVETMLRLFQEKGQARVVNDQIGAPTYAAVLADNISSLVSTPVKARGTFHYADDGEISWYDFACAIAEEALSQGLLGEPPRIEPIPGSQWPTPAKRPDNSRFDKAKAKTELALSILPWRRNLRQYFQERRTLHAQP